MSDDVTQPEATDAGRSSQQIMEGFRELASSLETQWLALISGGFASATVESMSHLSHTLMGRAASFDLSEVAELAGFVNAVIVSLDEEQPSLTRDEHNNVAIALRRITEALQADVTHTSSVPSKPAAIKAAPPTPIRTPLLYLVDDDELQVQQLAVQLSAHGFIVETFQNWQALFTRMAVQRPDGIVADIGFPGDELAGIEAVSRVKQTTDETVPVVFLSAYKDTDTRLASLRAGGQGYFSKPAWIPGLAAKLHELTGDNHQPYRVLLVDDDQDVLELHQALLMAQGFQVEALNDPHRLVETALNIRPEAVVLDLHMPGASGIDLARVLRQDEAFFEIPVVFLSAERDPVVHQQAIAEGGMDFFEKPLDPDALAAVLNSRAGLYRRKRVRDEYLNSTDPTTGLYNRAYLTDHLEMLEQQPRVSGQQGLGFLYVELDNFLPIMRCTKAEDLNQLRERVARTIKAHLRHDDMAACYNDHVYVVLSWQSSTEELLKIARLLCQDIASGQGERVPSASSIKLTTSIGIYWTQDGNYKQALVNAAMACSYALQDGGNRVYLHDDIQLQQELVEQKRHWLQQIKNALNNQRFFLVYQPMSSFQNEKLQFYELFLRMLDDNDEVLLPKQFLGIVRQLGLLLTLDRWVVSTALRDLQNQQQHDPAITFFIKLSESSLGDERFITWLTQSLQRAKLSPGTCVFQVTEKVALAQQTTLVKLATVLGSMGAQLALENVGESDAWEQLIGRIPLQYVKLAQSITRELHKKNTQAKFRAILDMARANRVQVIASYVENAGALSVLYQHQVDLIQGYFLQAPDRQIGKAKAPD